MNLIIVIKRQLILILIALLLIFLSMGFYEEICSRIGDFKQAAEILPSIGSHGDRHRHLKRRVDSGYWRDGKQSPQRADQAHAQRAAADWAIEFQGVPPASR